MVSHQVTAALNDVIRANAGSLTVAYEPLWAIGTGKECPVQEANRVAAVIRAAIDKLFDLNAEDGEPLLGSTIPILYGGSVKSSTIEELMNEPQIDGALVGGASLEAEEVLPIILGGVRRTKLTPPLILH
jgi:triosephosphate isomerase